MLKLFSIYFNNLPCLTNHSPFQEYPIHFWIEFLGLTSTLYISWEKRPECCRFFKLVKRVLISPVIDLKNKKIKKKKTRLSSHSMFDLKFSSHWLGLNLPEESNILLLPQNHNWEGKGNLNPTLPLKIAILSSNLGGYE